MATTRKRTTTTAEQVVEKPEAKVTAQKEKPVVKEKKKFSDADGIVCRSIIQGGLYMEGAKTHMLYEWVEYGDKTQVEYADLAAAVRTRSPYLFGPMLIIEDEDFIEEFPQLKKFYTENYTVSDLEMVLAYPLERMLEEISALPKSAVESLKVLAASSINEGTLDSVKKIKALDEIFGTNLSLLAEFKN